MIVHSYIQVPGGMGFGDFLRGSLALYQLCARERSPLAITFKDHPVGKYLTYPETQDTVIHNLNNKCDHMNELRRRVTAICPRYRIRQNYIGVLCNTWPRFPISSSAKDFLRKSIVPTPELQDAITAALPSGVYEVIHIRSGDMMAFKTAVNFTVEYDIEAMLANLANHVSHIKNNTKNECILICDSDEIKKTLSERCGIRSTATTPVHMNVVSDHAAVMDTLVDFFILTKAHRIYQFSVHGWGSGFSSAAEWIYDVPVKPHRLL